VKILSLFLLILIGSCGVREPKYDDTRDRLYGVWDQMIGNNCYQRYVFYKNATFSFYDKNGMSNGSYNLNLQNQTMGLFHKGVAADYLPFNVGRDGRMSVFRNGQNHVFVKVPDEYAYKYDCPGEIPDDDDGGGDPTPTPTVTPKPTPTEIPDGNGDGNGKCKCKCTCKGSRSYGFDSLECHRPLPMPIPQPVPPAQPCPPCETPKPIPVPPIPSPDCGGCECECECNC
jgi:hypothetical protein